MSGAEFIHHIPPALTGLAQSMKRTAYARLVHESEGRITCPECQEGDVYAPESGELYNCEGRECGGDRIMYRVTNAMPCSDRG